MPDEAAVVGAAVQLELVLGVIEDREAEAQAVIPRLEMSDAQAEVRGSGAW